MSLEENSVWSNTDFPYACLLDAKRTIAFKQAIQKVVSKNDVVVEIGAGTGILSLFAAEAGAAKVYAVEIDPVLAGYLRETVAESEFKNVIEIVEGDAMAVNLPKDVDVVIAEIIETGLLDEMQVEVINSLHQRGIIGAKTKLIPESYETFLELVDSETKFYGHKLKVAQHRWPYYNATANGWHEVDINPVSDKQKVVSVDFRKPNNDQRVEREIIFNVNEGPKIANNIRLSGTLTLTGGVVLNETNALNGDKVLPIKELNLENKDNQIVRVTYQMGAGISTLKIHPL